MIVQIHRAALFDLWIFTKLYAECAPLAFTNSYALLIFAIWIFESSCLIPKFVDKSQYFPSDTQNYATHFDTSPFKKEQLAL
jgi:hypothetical protein